MNEINTAIYNAIRSNTACMALATGVYYGAGDAGAMPPFYVLYKQPRLDADRYTFGSRAARLQRYVVKAVDVGMSKRRAQEMHDLADVVLTDSQLAWLHCHRTGDVEYAEDLADGRVAWHVGGIYEITVTQEVP